ncbi:MAG: hypothetical protein AAGJ18_24090 [Bacteroidota bacterium]
MEALDQYYVDKLNEIAEEVQASEELAKYLEEEEEADYKLLQEMFEPKIGAIYESVSAYYPLQLIALEKYLLDERFEGLYLPKIIGFTVLRGEINDRYKYILPQDHFKDVLMAICNSANFDIIRQRIGQSVQMGFALSSDIWITNLLDEVTNKRIGYFLRSMKKDDYRILKERIAGYNRYKRQFKDAKYLSAVFPKTISELKVLFTSLKKFLIHRLELGANNESLIAPLASFISNEAFQQTDEIIEILALYANFWELDKDYMAHLNGVFNKVRTEIPDFDVKFLTHILALQNSNLDVDATAENRVSTIVDRSVDDQLTEYYNLVETIHNNGYLEEATIEAVHTFYNAHEGRSLINECVRKVIYGYYARLINNLEERDYNELIKLARTSYPVYMKIFGNQQFNQDVEDLSMKFVKKALKKYTDKRGKDYQDIKKFVSSTFVELNFMKEKEVVELFKTRRKKKKPMPKAKETF